MLPELLPEKIGVGFSLHRSFSSQWGPSTSTTSSNTKWFFTNKKKRLGLASLYTGASLHNGACLHQHFQKSKGLFAHGFSLQHILGASLYTGVYLHNGELHTNIFKNRSLSLHMAFFYSTSWGLLFAHLGGFSLQRSFCDQLIYILLVLAHFTLISPLDPYRIPIGPLLDKHCLHYNSPNNPICISVPGSEKQ